MCCKESCLWPSKRINVLSKQSDPLAGQSEKQTGNVFSYFSVFGLFHALFTIHLLAIILIVQATWEPRNLEQRLTCPSPQIVPPSPPPYQPWYFMTATIHHIHTWRERIKERELVGDQLSPCRKRVRKKADIPSNFAVFFPSLFRNRQVVSQKEFWSKRIASGWSNGGHLSS